MIRRHHTSSTHPPASTGVGIRTRWAAIGAAIAVTLGGVGIGGFDLVRAEINSGERAVLVTIDSCRLADTRAGEFNVGPRAIPLRAKETHTFNSQQSGVPCSGKIPPSATALALNVTATQATAPSFLTIWSGGSLPDASSLNPTPGEPPVPNAVTVPLAAGNIFNVYNKDGTVEVIIDVVGYYENHNHDDRYHTKQQASAAAQELINASTADFLTATQVGAVAQERIDAGTADFLTAAQVGAVAQERIDAGTADFLTAAQVGAVAQERINAQPPNNDILRADPADFVIARTTQDSGGNVVPATGWEINGTLFHTGTPNVECVYAPIRAANGTSVSGVSVRYTSAGGTTNGTVSLTGITTTPGPANFGTTGISRLVDDQSVEFFSDSTGVIRNVEVAPTASPYFVDGHVYTLQLCSADNALTILAVIVNTF